MLTWPVSALGWCVSIIQQAEASQKRINDFLQTKPDIESNGMGHMPTNSLQIEFDRVDFQYPGSKTKALTNFSISIPQGSRIAIVGKTASGKTSIAELLLRLYDPSLGSIRLGGIDLKTLPVDFIRKQIAYVPQDVFLFSETIEDNIAFGIENQDPQLVRKAAEYASVAAEIEEFPDSYKSILGERGVNVSGGQKQRISLARAFIRDSPIILLDDCLSAVDSQTEQRIMEGFESYLSGKTVILITQRLKQTVYMDNILVLERGKLVQNGNFETLVKEKGLFSQLYEIERKAESNIQEN